MGALTQEQRNEQSKGQSTPLAETNASDTMATTKIVQQTPWPGSVFTKQLPDNNNFFLL